jgi:hypothetical protein
MDSYTTIIVYFNNIFQVVKKKLKKLHANTNVFFKMNVTTERKMHIEVCQSEYGIQLNNREKMPRI